MNTPPEGPASGSNANFEAVMERAIASLEYIMTKQIEFTERSNPPKAGGNMATGSRTG